MKLIDERGKLFGQWNIIDALVTGAIGLSVLGVFLVQSGFQVTSGQVVEGESDIRITVQIPLLRTLDRNLFVPGQKTAITIRNQPRGEVPIDSATSSPAKMTLAAANGKPELVEDLAQVNTYDFTVVLHDHAKVTEDGYVSEGVKVKVGLPIELEGFKYRVYGKIVNVEAVESSQANAKHG